MILDHRIKQRLRENLFIFGFIVYLFSHLILCHSISPSWAEKLIADAGPDQEALVNEVVIVNAAGSTGNIISYEWDFGDGTIGEGKTAQHIYTQVGTYRVVLTIKDPEGNLNTDTTVVTIEHGLPPDYNETHPVYSPDGSKIAYKNDCRGNWDIWVINADGSGAPIAITSNEADDVWPGWSACGKKIVFSSKRSGNGDLYIKNADGTGEAQRLTTSDREETQPSWSPDGRWIAYRFYHSNNHYYIYIIKANGSSPTEICHCAHAPDWSPDGKKIVFYGSGCTYNNGDIYTKVIDGNGDGYPDRNGANLRITTHSGGDYCPTWSPDGLRVIFQSNRNGSYQIWEKNSDGTGSAMQITPEAETFDHYCPHFSPDGCRIVYHEKKEDTYDIHQIDYRDDQSAYPLVNIVSPKCNQSLSMGFEIIGTAANNLSVKDGTLLSSLASYSLEYGKGENPESWIEIITSTNQVINGILGQWNVMGLDKGIYTLRLTATDGDDINTQKILIVIENQHVIVKGDANEQCPVYSPDGTKIAYHSDISGNWDIWVRNTDGSGTPIQVTTDSASDYFPTWSPDGSRIAFFSDRTGNGDIYIKNAHGSGEPQRLTTDNRPETQPSWSPDGEWIAYRYHHSNNHYYLYIIKTDGTNSTSICHCANDPDWSPDGKRIVFYGGGCSYSSGDIYTKVIDGNGDSYPDNTGAEVRVTTNSAADYYPTWSPDGSKIVFSSNRQDGWNIYVKNADGTGPVERITIDIGDYGYYYPDWSPDGTKIAYYSNWSGNWDIYEVDYHTDETAVPAANIHFPILSQSLTGVVEIKGTAANNISAIDKATVLSTFSSYTLEYGIGASPTQWIEIIDSTDPVVKGVLATLDVSGFSRDYYTFRLSVTDGEDTVIRKTIIGIKHPAGDTSNEQCPAYSPDGTKIAYFSDISGNWDIWVRNTDGSGASIQITTHDASDYYSTWSPDGSRIAFYSDRTGNGDIYIKNADGSGEPQRLTTDGRPETQPSWSPDGKWIAYRYDHSNGHEYIYIIKADGTDVTQVSRHCAHYPDWSPDGKRIVFFGNACSYGGGGGDIYTKVIDGNGDSYPDSTGAEVRVTTNSAADSYPTWSPDGSKIAFSSNRTPYRDSWAIWAKNADGTGEAEQITHNELITIDLGLDRVYYPDWSPDGTKIVYHSNWSGNWDIYEVDYHTDDTAVPAANIHFPILSQTLTGVIEIKGTAANNISAIDKTTVLSAFSSYTLEYGIGASPTQWIEIANSTDPVVNGVLATLDVSGFSRDYYTLRLSVTDGEDTVIRRTIIGIKHPAGDTSNEQCPAYSPDGTKIAYFSDISGNWDIWVRNTDGSRASIQITTHDASDYYSTWSPDGSRIAFYSDRTGNGDIYIKNADGSGEPQRLTTDGRPETQPSWSPDGKWIAYRYDHSNGHEYIYIIKADGTDVTQVSRHCAHYPDWSPDGKRIVFFGNACSYGGGGGDIYTKVIDGNGDSYPDSTGAEVRVTTNSAADSYPTWSPDGTKIAFSSNRTPYRDSWAIWAKNADGTGEAEQITNNELITIDLGLDRVYYPDWSPDGTKIAYYSNWSGNWDIYEVDYHTDDTAVPASNIHFPILSQTLTGVIDIKGTAANNISAIDKATVLSAFSSYTLEYGIGASPTQWIEIANSTDPVINGILATLDVSGFSRDYYTFRLSVTDGEDTVIRRTIIGIKHPAGDTSNEQCPAYSPDGTKIAYFSDISGNWDIWVRNTDGSGASIQITTHDASDYYSTWSPDGSRIAFYSDRTGNGDIYIKNADGSGEPQRLTTDGRPETQPSWSPDGKWIAYRYDHSNGHEYIYIIKADGTDVTQVSRHCAHYPDWSPDGKRIVFFGNACSYGGGGGDIYTKVIDGNGDSYPDSTGAEVRVTTNSAADSYPTWSPDGTKIAFSSNRTPYRDSWAIWVKNADGTGEAEQITHNELITIDLGLDRVYYPDWSPDGTKIAYYSNWSGNWDIYEVDYRSDNRAVPAVNIVSPILSESFKANIPIDIKGTAGDNLSCLDGSTLLSEFSFYILEYGTGENPTQWTTLITSSIPVTNNTLYTWNVYSLPSGPYSLRLTAQDTESDTAIQQTTIIIQGVINQTTISKNPFNPSGNLPLITAQLLEECNWTLTILDNQSNPIRILSGTGSAISVYWDGKDAQGQIMPDGPYNYIIDASSVADGSMAAPVTGTITVDSSVAIENINITNIHVSSEPFKPDIGEYKEIWYTIDMYAAVTLKIYDMSNNLVRTVLNGVPQSPGPNKAFWDGRDSNGDIVPDGIYTFQINAIPDDPTYQSTVSWEGGVDITSSITGFSVSSSFNAVENSFCTIQYTLPQPALVRLRAGTASMPGQQLCTIMDNEPQAAGPQTVYWNGRDDQGKILAPDSYKIAIHATSLPQKALFVTSDIPEITQVSLTPNPFSPATNNPYIPESQRILNITYTLSKSSSVTLKIYDKNHALVNTLLDQVWQEEGAQSEFWDGKASNGLLAHEGEYSIEIQAQDQEGKKCPLQVLCIRVFY